MENSIKEILQLAISNGLFATLFTMLLFFVLRDSHRREKKYNETIKTLTDHIGNALNDVKTDVAAIKEKIEKIGKKIRQGGGTDAG